MSVSLKFDLSAQGISSVLAGAVAWGACGVSPVVSLAVLGAAELSMRVAQVVAKFLTKDLPNSGAFYLWGGCLLGQYAIYALKLPTLSWGGTFCLVVGAIFVRTFMVETNQWWQKNASQPAANN